MHHLVLFGPPGSGKGTQAKLLVERLHAFHLSTGQLFRRALAEGTPVGLEAKRHMESGELVPDAIVIRMVQGCLAALGPEVSAVLFDGFPRSLPQAEALEETLRQMMGRGVDLVLMLDIEDAEVIHRLSSRRECPRCGGIFNVLDMVPSDPSDCETCGGTELIQRPDDNPEAIATRLEVYHRETQPVIDYYEGLGILQRIDGKGAVEEIHRKVLQALSRSLGLEMPT